MNEASHTMAPALMKRPRPSGPPASREIKRSLVLLSHFGLHCRPAALLVRTLEEFNCQVSVEVSGVVVNGRSVLGLLSLAAGYGTRLTFVVSGPQADEGMAAIQRLFDDNFSDAYEPKDRHRI